VNAVVPNIVDTIAMRRLPHFEKFKANSETPLRLPWTLEDMTADVAFLASETAGCGTCDVLHASGGHHG